NALLNVPTPPRKPSTWSGRRLGSRWHAALSSQSALVEWSTRGKVEAKDCATGPHHDKCRAVLPATLRCSFTPFCPCWCKPRSCSSVRFLCARIAVTSTIISAIDHHRSSQRLALEQLRHFAHEPGCLANEQPLEHRQAIDHAEAEIAHRAQHIGVIGEQAIEPVGRYPHRHGVKAPPAL